MTNQLEDFPLDIKISFHKVVEQYELQLESKQNSIAKKYIENVLEYISQFPKLVEGIDNPEDLSKNKDAIRILLDDLFPNILSNNEIKAASLPFHNVVFNSSRRFKNILKNAGDTYQFEMRNMNEDMYYIYGCILVLNHHYGYNIDFSRPLYYDIPDENGILKHYRVALNADFID
ncbi:MAG: GAF domain-containing protein, partial [Gillisia sp.]